MAKQKRKTTRNIDATPKQNAAAIANLSGDVADLIKSHTELRRLIEAVDRKSGRAFKTAQAKSLPSTTITELQQRVAELIEVLDQVRHGE